MSSEHPPGRVSYIGGDGPREERPDTPDYAPVKSNLAPRDPVATPVDRRPMPRTSEDLAPAFLMAAVFITLVILIYHFLPATT